MNSTLRIHSPRGPVLHQPTPEMPVSTLTKVKRSTIVTFLFLSAMASAVWSIWSFHEALQLMK